MINEMLRDDSGASMVEYAIIAVGLALPLLVFLPAISSACGAVLNNTATWLTQMGQNGI